MYVGLIQTSTDLNTIKKLNLPLQGELLLPDCFGTETSFFSACEFRKDQLLLGLKLASICTGIILSAFLGLQPPDYRSWDLKAFIIMGINYNKPPYIHLIGSISQENPN